MNLTCIAQLQFHQTVQPGKDVQFEVAWLISANLAAICSVMRTAASVKFHLWFTPRNAGLPILCTKLKTRTANSFVLSSS
jgi:hypothetical protein